jgi:hypothetical protein
MQNNTVQQSIVRQSSLKFVQDYSCCLAKPLTIKEIIGMTNVIADFCENGYSKELGEKIAAIDKYLKDKNKI